MADTDAKVRETPARERKAKFASNLDDMSDEELREFIARARDILGGRVRNRMEEFRLLAREAGYEVSLTRIGEERGRTHPKASAGQDQRRAPLLQKYRNPDNPSQTWSGRGIAPKWMREQMERAGKSRDDFLIERLEGSETGVTESAQPGSDEG